MRWICQTCGSRLIVAWKSIVPKVWQRYAVKHGCVLLWIDVEREESIALTLPFNIDPPEKM